MKITDAAWEHIKKIVPPHNALRIGVRGGGCSGMSYNFSLEDHITRQYLSTTQECFYNDAATVVVDARSMIYLKGVTIDYEETLMRQGFIIDNPAAIKTCGCGSSFSV